MNIAPTGFFEVLAIAAGGLAMFLLAMRMMTQGLKRFAGNALRRLLAGWTSTPLRGVATGMLVTGAVQSSSAVTVATIGFVNAGILSLPQALGVIYGANVGTTVTSWLVSLVGLDIRLQSLALPLIAVGTGLLFAGRSDRWRGLGESLAGFGLFFLGLMILKDSLGGLAEAFDPTGLANQGWLGILLFLGVGFLITVLVQSSSAAIALILTSAGTGIVPLDAAAAAVIGANLGTTSTAAFAAIGATANARRVALGHIAFNGLAGLVSLILLVPLLWLIAASSSLLGLGVGAATTLALFHTAVKLIGLVVILPLTPALTTWLRQRFITPSEEIGRPRHLDETILATPALAIEAVVRELFRMRSETATLVLEATRIPQPARKDHAATAEGLARLNQRIADFITRLERHEMGEDITETMPLHLRTGRYLAEASRLAPTVATLSVEAPSLPMDAGGESVLRMLDLAHAVAGRILAAPSPFHDRVGDEHPIPEAPDADAAYHDFERAYQEAKRDLLRAGVNRVMGIDRLDALLLDLSRCRRMMDQLHKGARIAASAIPLAATGETSTPDNDRSVLADP